MALVDQRGLEDVYDDIRRTASGGSCSVLILPAPDCDALCACHILTRLLKSDCVLFKVRPVTSGRDVAEAREVLRQESIRVVVLLNCGALEDMPKLLEPPEGTTVLIIDTHRPAYHRNLKQTKELGGSVILADPRMGQRALDDVPSDGDSEYDFDEEFDSDDDEEDYDSVAGGGKRARMDSVAEDGTPRWSSTDRDRRRRKHRWREYYDVATYTDPTSLVLYKLAAAMKKHTCEELWLAIVGVTSEYLQEHFGDSDYETFFTELKDEAASLQPDTGMIGDGTLEGTEHRDRGDEAADVLPAGPRGYIFPTREYRFPLYRHSSLYDGMMQSEYLDARLDIWTSEEARGAVKRLLVTVGIPEKDYRQRWIHMSRATRIAFRQHMERHAREKALERVAYNSFLRQTEYRHPVSAEDVVRAATALLECATDLTPSSASQGLENGSDDPTGTSASWRDNFHEAFRALSPVVAGSGRDNTLDRGLERARQIQEGLARLVPSIARGSNCFASGSLRVIRIDNLTDTDRRIFTQPQALAKLGRHIADAQRVKVTRALMRAAEKKRGRLTLEDKRRLEPTLAKYRKPVVLAALNNTTQFYTVVGVPYEDNPDISVRMRFHEALKYAATACRDVDEEGPVHLMEGFFDDLSFWVHAHKIDSFLEELQVGVVSGPEPAGTPSASTPARSSQEGVQPMEQDTPPDRAVDDASPARRKRARPGDSLEDSPSQQPSAGDRSDIDVSQLSDYEAEADELHD